MTITKIMMIKLTGMAFFAILLVSCLAKDVFAPDIQYIQKTAVISPNQDGVQDQLILDLTIKDESFVKYWRIDIYNDKNELIKSYSSGDSLDELKEKLVFSKGNVEIPKSIIWDGKNETGEIVPDGTYTFRFIAMDSKKNITPEGTKTGTVVVDTDKPEVQTSIKDTTFSPNDDGSKDILSIDINIIKENAQNLTITGQEQKSGQTWNVDIINESGTVIKHYSYNEKGEYRLGWDGKDEEGNKVPDGLYQVKIYSTDDGGNYWEQIIQNISVDTKPTPVKIIAQDKIFSPNGDKSKDNIEFRLDMPVTEGVENWSVKIVTAVGEEVRSMNGNGLPDENMSWDGKNNKGIVVQEGMYKAILSLTYENGNKPDDESDLFQIDLTPPSATIAISPEIFSPDGNGIQDETVITQSVTKPGVWTGSFYNQKNELIKNVVWSEPPKEYKWNGINNENQLAEDGIYYYQLSGIDYAGNSYKSNKYKTEIYTKDTPIFLTAALERFSPNKDEITDKEIFEIKLNKDNNTEIKEWKLTILDKDNNQVYQAGNSGSIPKTLEWDGRIKEKNTAPDGEYTAHFTVTFKAGTVSTCKSKPFFVDLTPPVPNLKMEPQYFSPDGDGENDILNIQLSAFDPAGIKNWKLTILTPNKQKEFKAFEGTGEPSGIIKWNGLSKTDELVESVEDYPVKVTVTDNLGNTIEKIISPIMVDILVMKLSDGRLKVRISNIEFKPDRAEMTTSGKNKDIINLLAKALKKYDQHNIIIEGYANKYMPNLDDRKARDLSQRRALVVAKELARLGIKMNRMTTVGKGFDNPIIPWKPKMTKDEIDEMERNRRVEFYLIKAD